MEKIEGKVFDEERSLYGIKDTEILSCNFAGEKDGESSLKECSNIRVYDCFFALRYPLWHVKKFFLENSEIDEKSRAAIWYSSEGDVINCKIDGIKCLRECENIKISDTKINSEEFAWKCNNITVKNSEINSEYAFLDSKNISVENVSLSGKYSFQYVENMTISDSVFDTKDAFWHSKNVTVTSSVIKGEYLGWFSENLKLIDCKIIGTQPLCYCKNLQLINCETENCDLSFEYSEVDAVIKGDIDSVKNPKSGKIIAENIGKIINEGAVFDCNCEIITK